MTSNTSANVVHLIQSSVAENTKKVYHWALQVNDRRKILAQYSEKADIHL